MLYARHVAGTTAEGAEGRGPSPVSIGPASGPERRPSQRRRRAPRRAVPAPEVTDTGGGTRVSAILHM